MRLRRRLALALAFLALTSNGAFALDYPLQPEEVEEAYSLGRTTNREDLANFLNQYEHDFKYPADNPIAYVTSVEFRTPYEQIVLTSLKSTQYTKFKAAEDYEANAGAVVVRVVVALRMVLNAPVPPADSFQVVVSQEKPIEPQKTTSNVLCDPYSMYDPQSLYSADSCTIYTREILLRFDHDQFGRGKAKVKVLLPEGESLETKFDIDNLK